MEEERTLKEELRRLNENFEGKSKKKAKGFKIPRKARLGKRNLREGYVTVAVIHENGNLDFQKEPIMDSTIKLTKPATTIHAIDSSDILSYKGKPFIIQPKNKLNPVNPLRGKNETYGHSLILARMESDKILTKKKMGFGLIIGLVIAAIIGYSFLTGN